MNLYEVEGISDELRPNRYVCALVRFNPYWSCFWPLLNVGFSLRYQHFSSRYFVDFPWDFLSPLRPSTLWRLGQRADLWVCLKFGTLSCIFASRCYIFLFRVGLRTCFWLQKCNLVILRCRIWCLQFVHFSKVTLILKGSWLRCLLTSVFRLEPTWLAQMIVHSACFDGGNLYRVRNWVWKVFLSTEECLQSVSIKHLLKGEALGRFQCSWIWSCLVRSQVQSD